jgi:protoheme ferro-lyase
MSAFRRHVVLVTYGEPPSPSFFDQLRYSWRILLQLTRTVSAIPYPLLPVVALWRAGNRSWTWRREKYTSPLEPLTQRAAVGLKAALAAQAPEISWDVHVAYEFRDPSIAGVLSGVPADEPVDVLPMYVADSAFTHGIARLAVEKWLRENPRAPGAAVRVLPQLNEGGFAEVSARHVRAELEKQGIQAGDDCALVLAAHGTLLDPPRALETGRVATEKMSEELKECLAEEFGMILTGWLNHARGGRWTEPPAHQALQQIADAGYRRVVYYPFGFPTDNAETQIEGRLVLRTQPQLEATHLPCMNTSEAWLSVLASFVISETG